jgi:molybdopterin-biosynthesis enzyme MoeA-like protein
MAWPMLDWVLAMSAASLAMPPEGERAIVVHGAGESQLLPLMNESVARFPRLKVFSLPSMQPDGGRRIELGVRGDPSALDAALAHLVAGVEARGFRWEPCNPVVDREDRERNLQ